MFDALLLVAVIGGLFPLGAELWWVFELTSHFRLQYLALALPLLLLALHRRRLALAMLLTVSAAINVWPVLPYLPGALAAGSGGPLVILNVNVNAGNLEHDTILQALATADADIVTLIELSPALADRLGELDASFPHRVAVPSGDNFGLAVLSRYPLTDQEILAFGPTAAIRTSLEVGGNRVSVLAVHPVPPMNAGMAATRNRQLQELAAYTATIARPVVVCGDFNLSPYSPYFSRFESESGTLDARRGRGIGLSWPSFLPLLGTPIDHCFASEDYSAVSVKRLASLGSDHYPVRFELRVN